MKQKQTKLESMEEESTAPVCTKDCEDSDLVKREDDRNCTWRGNIVEEWLLQGPAST